MPHVQEAPVPPEIEISPPPSVPADVPNRPLSADEAALLALHHQPSLVAAQAQVTAAQGNAQVAESALGPTVSTSASYAKAWGSLAQSSSGSKSSAAAVHAQATGGSSPAATRVTPGWTLDATISQLLFDFDRTRDEVRQAWAQEREAQAGLTLAQAELVLEVKMAFYGFVQDQHLVTVAEGNLKDQQAHLALAKAQVNAGLGIPSDVVRAEAAVADAVFTLTQARTNATLARVALAEQIGIDPRTPLVPAPGGEATATAADLNKLVTQALSSRPEIVQAQQALQAAQFGVEVARKNNWPVVSGSAGWVDSDTDFPPGNNGAFVGVSASWTPFDSGLTKGLTTEARAGVQSAQAGYDSATLAVISDVTQSYLNLKTAEQHVPTAQAEVFNAQEALRLAQGRYKAGIGVFLDVLDAEAELVTANTNLVNAQTGVDQARAALAHAVNADPVLAAVKK
jgi:outer membrane protein